MRCSSLKSEMFVSQNPRQHFQNCTKLQRLQIYESTFFRVSESTKTYLCNFLSIELLRSPIGSLVPRVCRVRERSHMTSGRYRRFQTPPPPMSGGCQTRSDPPPPSFTKDLLTKIFACGAIFLTSSLCQTWPDPPTPSET